ncbi:hypothetical protein COD66_26965 [Bacillus cereus]|nr:hypothetical protein COD66_26965 [Bacillus cereus]
MGFRYRKSINIGGGVRLNVGKKGVGISTGIKGLRISHGADGKTRLTASIPGTGISYQKTLNKQQHPQSNKEFEHLISQEEALYEFNAKVQMKYNDGEMARDSVLINQSATVMLYHTVICITSTSAELGGDKMYFPLTQLEIEKKILEGRFFFKKYRDIQVRLRLESTFTNEYVLLVKDELIADSLIDWHNSYKEIMQYSPENIHEDLEETSSDEEEKLELTCTHCFTKDTIENWQIREDEENDSWWVYCKHCADEYEVSTSYENDIQHEADMLVQCPNIECIGEIPLYESDFDEGDTATVTCQYCLEQITFQR